MPSDMLGRPRAVTFLETLGLVYCLTHRDICCSANRKIKTSQNGLAFILQIYIIFKHSYVFRTLFVSLFV